MHSARGWTLKYLTVARYRSVLERMPLKPLHFDPLRPFSKSAFIVQLHKPLFINNLKESNLGSQCAFTLLQNIDAAQCGRNSVEDGAVNLVRPDRVASQFEISRGSLFRTTVALGIALAFILPKSRILSARISLLRSQRKFVSVPKAELQ